MSEIFCRDQLCSMIFCPLQIRCFYLFPLLNTASDQQKKSEGGFLLLETNVFFFTRNR